MPPSNAGLAISALSQTSARAGAALTITGSGFGSSQGTSTVTFGERVNELGFAPVAKKAAVTSWSDTSITVTVPSMSPGKAGYPGTYHPVYVTVGGTMSNSVNFYVDPVTVYSGQTFNAYSVPDNMHDVLFDGCTFATPTLYSGDVRSSFILFLDVAAYDITFVNCTIPGYTGSSGTDAGDPGVSGIKMYANPGNKIHDITFDHITMGSMSRMGMEWNSRGSSVSYNIALRNSTFAPVGAEAFSIDGADLPYNALIADCTFKGAGNLANSSWPYAYEINGGTHVETRNVNIYSAKAGPFVMGGLAVGTNPSYYLFKNVNANMGTVDPAQAYPSNGGGRFWMISNVSYSKWIGCTFNMGTAAAHVYNAGDNSWATCRNNDFGGSTVTGFCGSASGEPTTAAGFWNSNPAVNGNILPTRL
jgi:IPT/TIG domain